jgi:DNA-binding CsgD family transcriptional regulator
VRTSGAPPVVGMLPSQPSKSRLLTSREREVAMLIAQGRTSREIAEALVITERTADTHADRIRAKLGLHSRAEIVAWVLSRGLSAGKP